MTKLESIFDSPHRARILAEEREEEDRRHLGRVRIYQEQAARGEQFKNNLKASHARRKK